MGWINVYGYKEKSFKICEKLNDLLPVRPQNTLLHFHMDCPCMAQTLQHLSKYM